MKITHIPPNKRILWNLCGDGQFDSYKAWKREARYWRKKWLRFVAKNEKQPAWNCGLPYTPHNEIVGSDGTRNSNAPETPDSSRGTDVHAK